jgi:S-adenosylmethionine:diacylglycerol 3-amino-3-carboxypropyl transferase
MSQLAAMVTGRRHIAVIERFARQGLLRMLGADGMGTLYRHGWMMPIMAGLPKQRWIQL